MSQEAENNSIEVEDYDISKKKNLEDTENNEIPEDVGIHENDDNQQNSQKIQEHSESSQEDSESQNVQENSEETTESIENLTTPETSIEEPQFDASGVPA